MGLITDPGCAGEITGGMIVAGLVHAGVMRQGTRAVTLAPAVQQMIVSLGNAIVPVRGCPAPTGT